MKPIIAFVAAFVVGLGGATGAKVMMTKPAAPAKTAPDSSKATPGAKGDSGTADTKSIAEAADSAHAPAGAASTTDSAKRSAPSPINIKPPLPAPPTTQAAAPTDTAVQSAEKRLAKVFTSMEAKQAAAVLAHMTDGDVQIILGYVGPRQAASILAELPPERVAALSKLSMQKSGGSK